MILSHRTHVLEYGDGGAEMGGMIVLSPTSSFTPKAIRS